MKHFSELKKQVSNKSEAQLHYESLTKYFKYLVMLTIAAIAIIASVVVFFTFKDISEARNEVTQNISRNNKTVDTATAKAIKSFVDLKTQISKEVQDFKDEINNYAMTETKLKVAEAFEENKITRLIELTAEEKLKEKLGSIVEEQMVEANQRVENLMKVVPELVLVVDKIRNGDRTGLTLLDSLRFKAEDPLIRNLANDAFTEKARDYVEYIKPYDKDKIIKNYIVELELDPNLSVQDTVSVLKGILHCIQSNDNLNIVASAIFALNKITGEKFDMFDFKSINEWSKIYFDKK